jgi:hypothetical protein
MMIVFSNAAIAEDKINWQKKRVLSKSVKRALLVSDPSQAGVFIAELNSRPTTLSRHIPTHLQKWSPAKR